MEQKNKVSARQKLYRLRNRLKAASGPDVAISVMARQGETLETIETVARELTADLLVMGTAGADSPGVKYFGSQSTALIQRTPVPLLLVPPSTQFVPFKNIVVALDLAHTVDALALDKLLRFSAHFQAVLNVICVSTNATDRTIQSAAQGIRDLLKHAPHTVSLVKGEDLIPALLRFTAENRADLVIMMPQPHTPILFPLWESNTQQMARQSEVPVLALVS
ncbi:universal stress protein [Larkinella bovis]|uniref:Universal stress protein n=1 Tax=Larkinella bovis TaxID=683041 RepID=A0ABW0IMU3_9BACT